MKHLPHVSLQIKILGLVIGLIALVVGLISITFAVIEFRKEVENAENSAVQAATTLSYIPVIQEAASSNEDTSEVSVIVEQLFQEIGASGILINDRQGKLYYNASGDILDELSDENETYQALVFGSSYMKNIGTAENELLLGVSPIFVDYGNYRKVEGTVTVVFKMNEIKDEIFSDIKNTMIVSIIALIAGMLGSIVLSRSIRRDTLGLEPIEITSLYQERGAILQSVKEGILAVDSKETISMLNESARQILGIHTCGKGMPLKEVIQSSRIIEMLRSHSETNEEELEYNGKAIIINAQPILKGNDKIGTVASFRDKTEIKKMVSTLSEVKQYSEDLRAQTHEFSNKLYVLLGLIQLDKIDEAITFIQEETEIQKLNSDIIFNYMEDEKIQAILLGKMAKASEVKTEFTIDPASSLSRLPEKYELQPLLIIIGNLIDNAIEAVSHKKDGKVSFFATDLGNDIIFEVEDNGKGIVEETISSIFHKGISEKGDFRGYGLFNVKAEVEQLGGTIEFDTPEEGGTIFTVFLPG